MFPTSPLATGGAGPNFESKVGAYYLAALVLEGPARGAGFGATSKVRFQQAALGAPLDDIIIETESDSGRHQLHLQLKHRFTFSQSDREFGSVVESCWTTLQKPDFSPPGNRVGVAIANFPTKVKEHYSRVQAWAQSRASAADFFREIAIEGFAHREMRAFVERISNHLRTFAKQAATDEALLNFFRRLVIVDFDVMLSTSRDELHALDSLRRLVPEESLEGARSVYERLGAIAEQGNQTAGGYTPQTLRQRLTEDGMVLKATPRCMGDLARLAQETAQVLASIAPSIGGVVLDRSAIIEDVLTRVDDAEFVVLTGESGVGKSALLRSVAHARAVDGPVIALSWTRLANTAGWSGFASALGLENLLHVLVTALEGASRPCLVIDGVDRLDSVGAHQTVNDLIRAVADRPAGLRWGVVLTSQHEAISDVRQWLHVPATGSTSVVVPTLDDVDAGALGGALPHLAAVLSSGNIGPVVRNPFFLSILEQTHGDSAVQKERNKTKQVTEADVYKTWWTDVVGQGSASVLRQQTVLRLGERLLKARLNRVPVQELDGAVLTGLVRDRVLTHDRRDDTVWFAHDILERWAMCRVLGQQGDPLHFLADAGNPFWAFRSVQLLACARLEEPDGRSRWAELLEAADRDGVTRWAEAIIAAPLISTRVGELLLRVGDLLLANDGVRLKTLLHVLLADATRPDPLFEVLLRHAKLSEEERTVALQSRPTPIVERWRPVVEWLAPQLLRLPYRARETASRVMLLWQQVEPPLPYRREIAEAALEWRVIPRPSPGVFVYIDDQEQVVFDRLRDIVALSADVVPELIPGFLTGLLRESREHELKRWLADSPQRRLAQYAAGAYADFALDILTPDWRGTATPSHAVDERNVEEFPVDADAVIPPYFAEGSASRRHDRDLEQLEHAYEYTTPSPARGPFFVLLKANEAEGLRVVSTLTDRATAAWERRHENHRAEFRSRDREEESSPLSDKEPPLVLQLGDVSRQFFGGQDSYLWFRHSGNGPHPACSALMALELWMEQEIDAGRDADELLLTVLRDSSSTSVVAVCVAMCLAYPEKCRRAAVPFISNPWIWEWEITRFSLEQSLASFLPSRFLGLPSDVHEDLARSRNERPQRKTEIRQLAMEYVLSADATLREPVTAAIRNFPNDVSMLTETERSHEGYVTAHRQRMERFAGMAEAENYRLYQNPSGQIVAAEYVPPAQIQERDATALERFKRTNRYCRLLNWVHQSRNTAKPDANLTLAEAVEEARALSRPDDFTQPFSIDGDMEYVRLEAIAGVAALLPVLDATWMRSEGLETWCGDLLMAASRMPRDRMFGSLSLIHGDPLLSATWGLLTLVRLCSSDERIRKAAFDLVTHDNDEIGRAVVSGLQGAWSQDTVFCRNAIALLLLLATEHRTEWLEDGESREEHEMRLKAAEDEGARLKAGFLDNILANRLPKTISLDRPRASGRIRTKFVVRALTSVPATQVQTDPTDREWVTNTISTALAWTIATFPVGERNRPYISHDFPYEWPAFLSGSVAWLADLLAEDTFDERFLTPLKSGWPADALLMTDFLRAFTRRQLGQAPLSAATQRRWRTLTDTAIPAEALPSHSRAWFDRDVMESLELLVHVYHQRAVLPDDWGHARSFEDVYERWVQRVGHNATAFRALLKFAAGPGGTIPGPTLIRWVASAAERMSDRARVWREYDTGNAAAAALSKIMSRGGSKIQKDQTASAQLAALLEELGGAGVTLATQLREQI